MVGFYKVSMELLL